MFTFEKVHLVNNFALFSVGPVLLPALPVAGGHLHLTKDCQENFNGSTGETFSCPCVGKNFYRKQAFTRKKTLSGVATEPSHAVVGRERRPERNCLLFAART